MYYVLDDNKNKVEAYDKQGVLSALAQAIENGDLENIDGDSAFVTKIKGSVDGETHELSFVTQAQYNQLEQAGQLVKGAYYFITDDTSLEHLEEIYEELYQTVTNHTEQIANNKLDILDLQTNKANNSSFSNDTTTQFGDYSFTKRKLLWSGSETAVFNSQTNTGSEKTITFDTAASSTNARLEIVGVWGKVYQKANGATETQIIPQMFSVVSNYLYQFFINESIKCTTTGLTFSFKQTCLRYNLTVNDANIVGHRDSATATSTITAVYEIIE